MSDDPKDNDATEEGTAGPEAAAQEDAEERSPITLDRYLSKRRAKSSATWTSLVAMVLMLITLVLIIIYKDRCGAAVSGAMGTFDSPAGERPAVKFKIQPADKNP